MLLAIDVGNTNTVFATFQEDELTYSWRCETLRSRSADEYAVFLKQLFDLEKLSLSNIKDVIISSVVPDTTFHLEQFCEKYIKHKPLFVSDDIVDIKINLDNPGELGADRLVNAIAVITHYSVPAIVLDFGTATTFDVIDKNGVYCGGVIAPGIRLSAQALTQAAAKLPQINIDKPKRTIGKSTRSAMKSGMYWGYLGMIEKIVDQIKSEMNDDMTVLATGGLAPLYASSTNHIDVVDDNLIFKGLLEIYKNNKDKRS
ncbi:MAG: type III pantothenate kinase [Alphaproteobacteria bacterium]|nr:type III pantothenate kinase [Alphaproteobacteria bacterium]